MKSNKNQDFYDPLFDLDKRIRESNDIIAQYWSENPDLLAAVKEKVSLRHVCVTNQPK